MSWLISRALMEGYESLRYSPELVEEFSAGTCSDGELSSLSSANPTPQAYLPSDRMTAFSRLSRFGMTFAPLTESRGTELLTSYLAGFHVKTFRRLGAGRGSTENAPDCGRKWRELSVRYDRKTSSWRTHRSLLDEDLSACSLTLPKWGLMRDGVLSELQTLERPTAANAAGLWPTTTVCGNYNRKGLSKSSGDWLATAVKTWPTPTASTGGPEPEGKTGRKLATAVKQWPTPVATMSKGSSPAALTRKSGADRSNDRLDHAVMAQDGGQLNPDWVEALMGWPVGWTSLKPLAIKEQRADPWSPDWEDNIPRIETRVIARTHRLKAIGNGQVPLCAATAFRILSQ